MALEVLRRVAEERAYSNLALGAALERHGLPERDRRLAADLVYGTLRRTIPIDRALALRSRRPLVDLDPEVLAVLRLGAYQVLATRIPPHAAVGETVGLAPRRARGFANAVLRAVAADPPAPPPGDDDESVSGRTGLAAWGVAELRGLLPPGEVEAAAGALAAPAALSLRANRCRTTPEALAEALEGAGLTVRPGRHHPDVLLVEGGAPRRLPGYREGWFAVQDEASVLVGAAVRAAPGERILDACAGPGGKAGHLACAVGPGGLLVAADRMPRRAALVREAAGRLGVPVAAVAQDARRPAVAGPFDAVLVDAPCSGVGAARRRPELLWRPARDAPARLAAVQREILGASAALVRPGGRLVYSVCTFPVAETDEVVAWFLASHPEFAPDPVPGPSGEAVAHRLWPHRDGTDGMFYAGFRRHASTSR